MLLETDHFPSLGIPSLTTPNPKPVKPRGEDSTVLFVEEGDPRVDIFDDLVQILVGFLLKHFHCVSFLRPFLTTMDVNLSKRVPLGQGLLLYFGGTRLLCVSAFEPLNRLFSSSRVHS